jgi:antitoxin MazE
MAIQQVLKWGNSLALRIPSAIAKQMRVTAGGKVEIRIEGTTLVVEPAGEQLPPFAHKDLIKALKRVRRAEDRLGRPRGREVL